MSAYAKIASLRKNSTVDVGTAHRADVKIRMDGQDRPFTPWGTSGYGVDNKQAEADYPENAPLSFAWENYAARGHEQGKDGAICFEE